MTQRILRTGVNNKKGRKDTSNKSMIFGSDKKKWRSCLSCLLIREFQKIL